MGLWQGIRKGVDEHACEHEALRRGWRVWCWRQNMERECLGTETGSFRDKHIHKQNKSLIVVMSTLWPENNWIVHCQRHERPAMAYEPTQRAKTLSLANMDVTCVHYWVLCEHQVEDNVMFYVTRVPTLHSSVRMHVVTTTTYSVFAYSPNAMISKCLLGCVVFCLPLIINSPK